MSSATIALAFLAQVTQMGAPFVLFSLIVLPCLYFIGLVTFVRAVQVAIEDLVHARGIARVRHYYVEIAPAVEKYLVHSTHDDDEALLTDRALSPSNWQSFLSTAGLVSVIASAIAGVFVGILAVAVADSNSAAAAIAGILVFVANVILFRRYHVRTWTSVEDRIPAQFPSG